MTFQLITNTMLSTAFLTYFKEPEIDFPFKSIRYIRTQL